MGKIADDVWPLFVMACGGYTMVTRPISAIEVLITRTYSGLASARLLMRAVSGTINTTLPDFEQILFAHLARRNV